MRVVRVDYAPRLSPCARHIARLLLDALGFKCTSPCAFTTVHLGAVPLQRERFTADADQFMQTLIDLGRSIAAPLRMDGPRWICAALDVLDGLPESVRGELSPDDPVLGLYEVAHLGRREVERCARNVVKPRGDTLRG